MKERLKSLGSSAAFGMMGIGPKPVFAPPNEGGNGGGQADQNDDGGQGDGDNASGNNDGGNDGGDGKGDQSAGGRAGKLGGLFGKRSNNSGGQDGGDGGAEGEGEGGGEAPKDGRPEGLADKFWDAKNKTVNTGALTKAYQDLERAHGELKRTKTIGGEVPKDPADYFKTPIELPDTVDRLTVAPDDPGLKVAANVFQKYGIGKDVAANIVKDMFVGMNEFAPEPIDPDQEFAALGKGGPAMVDGLFTWVEGLERAGDLSEDDIDVIEGMMMTANGARLLAKFRNMSGEKPIPINPGSGKGGMSQAQWQDEYKAAVKAKDYKRQEELDRMGEQINGTSAGISGPNGGINI